MKYEIWNMEYGIWNISMRYDICAQISLCDFQHVIDALDASCGSCDISSPGPDLSVFDIASERDHAVLHFNLRADDAFRDIPRFDPRHNRQIARPHARAFSGAAFAVRHDRDVIDDARCAFGVSGYPLGLLLIGLPPDY